MSTQETAALIEAVNNMTATVAGKMGQIDQKVAEAVQKTDSFIAGARNEYIRFTHYIELQSKVVIPPLGLSNSEVDAYAYNQESSYQPKDINLNNCFADIIEFANGFSSLPIPDGMSVYLHLIVNVAGHVNVMQETRIHLLRKSEGDGAYHYHSDVTAAYVLDGVGGRTHSVFGRDWVDNYKDRNILKITNFAAYNGVGHTTLRVLNLGLKTLEIFGVGVEVRA